MLYLNLQRVCSEKEISNPVKYLKKVGIPASTLHKLMHYEQVKVSYQQLEKLCIALHCTPNDLICWQPSNGTELPAQHPLHKLRREASATVSQQLHQMTMEEIEKVKEFMKQMKEQKQVANE